MVIGWSNQQRDDAGRDGAASPWKRIEEAQQEPRLPCLLVPQPAHAVLAGDLADALLDKAFGPLPPEIKQAILMHDTGWAMTDAAQIQHLRSETARAAKPVSFVANSPQESAEAWTASINSVERMSPAGGLIVSLHFTLLARQTEQRSFIAAERSRQRRLKAKCRDKGMEVARWVAALGFCDLLSLYLLCGFQNGAEFPLAHPSSPEAAGAPRAALKVEDDLLYFTPQIFHAGARIELDALRHPISGAGSPRTERLSWQIA
jgi:hypothetical protein